MSKGKYKRDSQQALVGIPTGGLLVPQSGDDRQYTKTDTDSIQDCQTFTTRNMVLYFAMLYTIDGIDVQSHSHPQDQTDPSVGWKENHHAQACQDTQNRNKRNERCLEGTFYIRHALADNQDAGAYQCKGEQSTDTYHFSGYTGWNKGGHDTYNYHEK